MPTALLAWIHAPHSDQIATPNPAPLPASAPTATLSLTQRGRVRSSKPPATPTLPLCRNRPASRPASALIPRHVTLLDRGPPLKLLNFDSPKSRFFMAVVEETTFACFYLFLSVSLSLSPSLSISVSLSLPPSLSHYHHPSIYLFSFWLLSCMSVTGMIFAKSPLLISPSSNSSLSRITILATDSPVTTPLSFLCLRPRSYFLICLQVI